MITAITFVFILICVVEGVLITREFLGTRRNVTAKSLLAELQNENRTLSEKLVATEKKLDEAHKELQGIHLLWNKALLSEQGLRQDLEIAKTQLTYLAQTVLKIKSETKTYWSEEVTTVAAPPKRSENLRAFKNSSELIARDFL